MRAGKKSDGPLLTTDMLYGHIREVVCPPIRYNLSHTTKSHTISCTVLEELFKIYIKIYVKKNVQLALYHGNIVHSQKVVCSKTRTLVSEVLYTS